MAHKIFRLTITSAPPWREEVNSIHYLTEEALEHYNRVIIPDLPAVKATVTEHIWVRDLEDVKNMKRR